MIISSTSNIIVDPFLPSGVLFAFLEELDEKIAGSRIQRSGDGVDAEEVGQQDGKGDGDGEDGGADHAAGDGDGGVGDVFCYSRRGFWSVGMSCEDGESGRTHLRGGCGAYLVYVSYVSLQLVLSETVLPRTTNMLVTCPTITLNPRLSHGALYSLKLREISLGVFFCGIMTHQTTMIYF